MKRIISTLFCILLISGLCFCHADYNTVIMGSYDQNGNTDRGGEPIEWVALDEQDGVVLLLSRYILDVKAYNDEYIATDWESSSIRKWLNDVFLTTAFTADEQEKIQTRGNTEDRIFLLSDEELENYFGPVVSRLCVPTESALENGAVQSDKHTLDGVPTSWWWLRSAGRSQTSASAVGSNGTIRSYDVDHVFGGVRPAMWVALTQA